MRPDLVALARRLPARPLTRFAPSPTGYLHLGHVVNALYVWGIARALGGRVLLRVEDHDRIRSRAEYERSLFEDLAWLGFEADVGPVAQRDAGGAYEEALRRLAGQQHIYACDCSRRDLTERGAVEPGLEIRYAGRCRHRGLDTDAGGIRLELAPGGETFEDALMGSRTQDPSTQCGDPLLRDRDGHWTYQFTVTVDDVRQGVDLVIRGADLLSSTGRQIRLARLLGRRQPAVFLHHPILLKPTGEKLSKSSGDAGVGQLRASGVSAADVIGRAAAAVGLIPRVEPIEPDDIARLFTG